MSGLLARHREHLQCRMGVGSVPAPVGGELGHERLGHRPVRLLGRHDTGLVDADAGRDQHVRTVAPCGNRLHVTERCLDVGGDGRLAGEAGAVGDHQRVGTLPSWTCGTSGRP